MTRKQKDLFEQYKCSIKYHGKRTLYDCYQVHSQAKEWSYQMILNEYRQLRGKDITVISYNGWQYTIGFIYDVLDGNTGEVLDIRFRRYSVSGTLDYSVMSLI